jgi:sugar phosphate isomerase/epimerase
VELALAPGCGVRTATVAELDTYLGAVAGAGFTAVSLDVARLPGDPAAVAAALARSGLRCTDLLALTVTRDEERTRAAVEHIRPWVQGLGAGAVLTLVWTTVTEHAVERLAGAADALGVPLALEFSPGPVATLDDALSLAAQLGAGRATVLADSYHFARAGSTWAMLETAPLDRIGIVQFADALPAASADYLAETVGRRTWPGDGELPLARFAGTLRNRGWNGVVSVEVLSEEHRRLPAEEFARRAYASAAPYWR